MFVTAYTPSSPLFRCDVVRRVGLAISRVDGRGIFNPGGAVRRKNVEKRMKTHSEGCESRLVELRDTKARAVS